MPPIESVESSLGLDSLDIGRFEVTLMRMVAAGLLGAFLGYRLWRRLLPNTLPPARETAQAQTLIAIAGALMVVVIGQSTARAFGLVGLGGFIRFRSGIKDTRDAAVMFVMIGIGMACGLGAVPMAVVATLFTSVVRLSSPSLSVNGRGWLTGSAAGTRSTGLPSAPGYFFSVQLVITPPRLLNTARTTSVSTTMLRSVVSATVAATAGSRGGAGDASAPLAVADWPDAAGAATSAATGFGATGRFGGGKSAVYP